MGDTDGDLDFQASNPDITYNAANDRYLVVWHGDDEITGNDVNEIWGQRLAPTAWRSTRTIFALAISAR